MIYLDKTQPVSLYKQLYSEIRRELDVIVLTAVFVRSIYGIRAEDHDRPAAHTS